ncbi:hypothetical protein FGRMN_1574 [Fusarium graminum]|nr:hypothetical protein FGRMN_1574 [Fusarium graminum]
MRGWKKHPKESLPRAAPSRPPIIPELPEEPEEPERESSNRDKREPRNHSREKSPREASSSRPVVEESKAKRPKRKRIRPPRKSKARFKNPISDEPPPKEPPASAILSSSPEDYQRIGISNLTKGELDYLARITQMNATERRKNIQEQMGWSLKLPYSKELYTFPRGQPKHAQLWRRVVATERLRMVMGHGVKTSTRNLWLKELPLRLRRSNMRDVRFICIDTDKVERLPQVLEGEWKRRVTSFQLGVAILDTRDIRDFIVGGVDVPNPSEIISTYQFSVQADPPEHEEFLFGKTQSISLSDLRAKFVEWQTGRDVIGIAYSSRNDMIILKDFNISLNSTFSIDLCQATYLIVQEPTAPTLGLLLHRLRIRSKSLHAPGNDAHFTMRALLGLAALDVARGLEAGRSLNSVPPWFQLAVNIARSPVPPRPSGPRRERKRVRTDKRKPKRKRGAKKEGRATMASG